MIFRRIGGRIIPIDPERRRDLKKGAASIAGGAATAAGAGFTAARMVKTAQRYAGEAKDKYRVAKSNFRAAGMFDSSHSMMKQQKNIRRATQSLKEAVGIRIAAKGLFRARNYVLHAGAAASALLIGHGVNKIREAYGDRKKKSRTAGGAASVAAAVGTYGAYYRALGFKRPLEIAVNTYARFKGSSRPFKKYGSGGEI